MEKSDLNLRISDLAKQKLENLLSQAANEGMKLRIAIEGGGCSGFKYQFTLDKNQSDEDILIENQVVVDYLSLAYLQGATLDFKESLHEAGFTIQNPQAKATCGCGASFSIG